jgi:poly(A) polymerase
MPDFLARLKTALGPLPVHSSPADAPGAGALRRSAVLIPIVMRPAGPTLLFTRRADHLKSHAGQVSFPGGRIEPFDETPAHAALREAFEEIGLEPRLVSLQGALASHETGTGFFVTPVVGLVEPGFSLAIDAAEVAEIFEVPVAYLMDPRNHERHRRNLGGQERVYYTIPYDGQTIWGATAAMVVMLYEALYGAGAEAEPALSLAGKPWMSAPATRRLLAALEAHGAPARFVGGCVRNALIGVPVKDIDIATPEEPAAVMRLLEAAGIRVVPTGFAHGTVTAILEGAVFEITSLRRDVATDGRHATIAFTRDWAEDAKRRDFTMNAIYAGADGTLYDYVDGVRDLHTRHVRFIGDPARRIAEDYLRILRFFRFHAWYGRGALDPPGLSACAVAKDGLKRLSGERIAQELRRLLEAPSPQEVLVAMKQMSVLAAVLPEAEHLETLSRLLDIELVIGGAGDWLLRLAALIGRDAGKLAAAAGRLKLSNELKNRLARFAARDVPLRPDLADQPLRAALYRLGPALFRDSVLLDWAASGAELYEGWYALFMASFAWTPPEFPLKGADVVAAGVPEGPEVGRILTELEEAWIAEDFKADRAQLLARLKS